MKSSAQISRRYSIRCLLPCPTPSPTRTLILLIPQLRGPDLPTTCPRTSTYCLPVGPPLAHQYVHPYVLRSYPVRTRLRTLLHIHPYGHQHVWHLVCLPPQCPRLNLMTRTTRTTRATLPCGPTHVLLLDLTVSAALTPCPHQCLTVRARGFYMRRIG